MGVKDKLLRTIGIGSKNEETTEDPEEDVEESPDEEVEEEEEQSEMPDIGQYHREIIAPSGVIERSRTARIGEHWTQTLFIEGWPDEPQDGFLEEMLLQVPTQNDIGIHVDPYRPDLAIAELENSLKKAEARLGDRSSVVSQGSQERRFKNTQEIYNALTETDANLFEVGMYITVRNEDEEELKSDVDQIVRTLKTHPALCHPEVLSRNQMDGLKSVSPIGEDYVGHSTKWLGGAVGAMIPFSSTSLVHSNGVDFGMHATNRSPVIIDRFSLDNGYNQLTIGKIGSGKSFSTSLNVLRSYAAYDDILVFILDPLSEFHNIAEVLDGKTVTVGGTTGINPMRIRETPEEALQVAADMDPYAMKKNNLHDFFEMYFHTRGIELDEYVGVLEKAIDKAYEEHDITSDVTTHSNKSPTIRDLMNVLKRMGENPKEFADTSNDEYLQLLHEGADMLRLGMQEFEEGGQLDNLSGESTLDLRSEDVVYFDLSQYEGSGNVGLMMHVLLSSVYERAKETDKKVVFHIDEAHYIMQDAKSLNFLEQVVRHSRHYDLSLNFITQTIKEFFSHEKSSTISEQCSIRLFHRIEQGLNEEVMDQLDLTEQEAKFIRQAQPGDPEVGYSEALIEAGRSGYMPLRVYPSELEEEVITTDVRSLRGNNQGVRQEIPDEERELVEALDEKAITEAIQSLNQTASESD